jgi:hypothetical protein
MAAQYPQCNVSNSAAAQFCRWCTVPKAGQVSGPDRVNEGAVSSMLCTWAHQPIPKPLPARIAVFLSMLVAAAEVMSMTSRRHAALHMLIHIVSLQQQIRLLGAMERKQQAWSPNLKCNHDSSAR